MMVEPQTNYAAITTKLRSNHTLLEYALREKQWLAARELKARQVRLLNDLERWLSDNGH